ncbi:hypothetical protein OQZ33_08070 [Pedobacter sp. MC2016-05]|uniref:hypothetical protein n=1 Tax=Pedobacter sp. MC2016-05 TaxID=2994474 RepID=UPI002246A2C5|nr:hypothetical protein [Pedobacter sp. MC2016-05]MCX2474281.1 hypothetical protein [Pedobacter sp. MC2016-05]
MALAYINISAKQYFNFMCRSDFERRIFHDTYKEFQEKSKPYTSGERLNTFSQMILANKKAKDLHQKLHYSVMEVIEKLGHQIPILKDENGNAIKFEWAELEIIDSDLLNKAAHVVSLTYTSPKMLLHEIDKELLVLSEETGGKSNSIFKIKMTEKVRIEYIQKHELVYS